MAERERERWKNLESVEITDERKTEQLYGCYEEKEKEIGRERKNFPGKRERERNYQRKENSWEAETEALLLANEREREVGGGS